MDDMDIIAEQQPVDSSGTNEATHNFIPRLIEAIVIRGAGHVTVFALNNQFDEEFPHGLAHKVSREEYQETITRVNTILRKNVPNHFKWLLCGCICCCCTIGLSFCPVICLNKRSKNAVNKALDSENARLYHRLGLHWQLTKQKCANNNTVQEKAEYTFQIRSISMRHAVVKSVISGDSLVVRPAAQSSFHAKEQQLFLNHIKAPKLARPPSNLYPSRSGADEPYAFEAREYLRRKLVGQEICYTIDTLTLDTDRSMCTVYLGRDKNTGENIIESLVSGGLVELQQPTEARASTAFYQHLLTLDEQARTNKRGRYSDDLLGLHRRAMKWVLQNPKQFLSQHRSSPPLDAIVEFVRDGNTVRCLLLPSYHLVTIQLAGIRCPMFRRKMDSVDEAYANEAKEYTESHLLQRQVRFVVGGTNKQSLVGTLLSPDGNIAVQLLENGLARCVDWSLTFLEPGWREQYRAAEKVARDQCLRIWQDDNIQSHLSAVTESNDACPEEYEAKVLEVVNGDALIIRDTDDQQVKKIYLSSVRAPRAADFQLKSHTNTSNPPRHKLKRPLYEVAYLFEARELLRQRLIGKNVRVIADYIQPACNGYVERICCTVYLDDSNIGEELIARGLAKAVRHRQDGDHRSSRYDDLLVAEHRAEEQAVGLFSAGVSLRSMVDLTCEENKVRARGLLSTLQRSGRLQAIVEYVASGSRFRVHLLKHDWIISLLLSTIDCPHGGRQLPTDDCSQEENAERNELSGAEALAFSKENFLQRDVYVEVEGLDRFGNFMGRLITMEEQSAALMLVQAGLARVHRSALDASDHAQLLNAEAQCKSEQIGIWAKQKESSTTSHNGETGEEETVLEGGSTCESEAIDFDGPGFRLAMVSYISPELKVSIQYAEQADELEHLQVALREIFEQTEPTDDYTPNEEELLAARFSADDEWYRARVENIEEDNRVSIYFVDYGNRETITDLRRLAALPPEFLQLPAHAHVCEFAYVQPLPNDDARQAAQQALLDAVGNDECLIKVEYHRDPIDYVSLYRAGTKENLVKTLAEQSLITMAQGQSNPQMSSALLLDPLRHVLSATESIRYGF